METGSNSGTLRSNIHDNSGTANSNIGDNATYNTHNYSTPKEILELLEKRFKDLENKSDGKQESITKLELEK